VDGLSFLSIDPEESIWLEREFEEQEVWEVVRDLNGDKAWVRMGSLWLSFKCWGILKQYIMAVFSEFHNRRQFEKSFNATFVSLIPKNSFLRSFVTGSNHCWGKLFLALRMLSLEDNKYWIQFS